MSLFIHTVWSTLSLVGSGEYDRLSGPLDSSRFLLASANCPCSNCMTMRGFPGIIFLCISRFITHFTLCLMESCSFFFFFFHTFSCKRCTMFHESSCVCEVANSTKNDELTHPMKQTTTQCFSHRLHSSLNSLPPALESLHDHWWIVRMVHLEYANCVSNVSVAHCGTAQVGAGKSRRIMSSWKRSQQTRKVSDTNSWCYDCRTSNPSACLSWHRSCFCFPSLRVYV